MTALTDSAGPAAATAAQPNGVAAAAMLAAGIGALAMGIVTTLAEASSWVHDALEWNVVVGPLSGKSLVATIVFVVALVVLVLAMRHKTVKLSLVFWATLVLVALGTLGTLPTFFTLFAE